MFTRKASGPAPASDDPVQAARLRARQRLVGAALLLVVGVVAFPLLFETKPRPLPLDTPIVTARAPAPAQPAAGSTPQPRPVLRAVPAAASAPVPAAAASAPAEAPAPLDAPAAAEPAASDAPRASPCCAIRSALTKKARKLLPSSTSAWSTARCASAVRPILCDAIASPRYTDESAKPARSSWLK